VEEGADTREAMIKYLRYRNEKEKLSEFPPPMIRLWTRILGNWPSPSSGGCRYLLQAGEWFLHQMKILADARIRWLDERVLESPSEEDRVYSRFNLSMEGLDDQSWKAPVEGIRGMKRPGGIKIPLLYIDISRVKSKDIGKICTDIGRSQRWSLLEWGRMNPSELTKFFVRMEKDVGFQRFYGGLYDGMRLCHMRILNEKAPVVEEVEKRLRQAVGNSLQEEMEGLMRSEEETRKMRKRVAWLNNLASDWEHEERTKWRDETPALNPLKKASGVKRKSSSRPGKLKMIKMRSMRESGAGSTVEEPVGISPSQPTPGYSWFILSQE